jgi:hypothetical protein
MKPAWLSRADGFIRAAWPFGSFLTLAAIALSELALRDNPELCRLVSYLDVPGRVKLWLDMFLGWFLPVGPLRISLVKVGMQIRELGAECLGMAASPLHLTDALVISRLCA